MTINQIIKLLELDKKEQLLNMLKNANDVELKELRDSIELKLEFEKEKHYAHPTKYQYNK